MRFNFDNANYHKFFDDFDRYVAADWTITETGSGSRALTNVDGGCLLVTNGASNNDANYFQKVGEGFAFEAGKRLYFEARFKTNDATLSDWVMGLQITDTTPLAVSDGLWFQKATAGTALDFHVAGASTQTDKTAIATWDTSFHTLAFYYDGSNAKVAIFMDGVQVSSAVITNAPLVTRTLTVSFGQKNGEAVAKTMTVDYIFVAKQRSLQSVSNT